MDYVCVYVRVCVCVEWSGEKRGGVAAMVGKQRGCCCVVCCLCVGVVVGVGYDVNNNRKQKKKTERRRREQVAIRVSFYMIKKRGDQSLQ